MKIYFSRNKLNNKYAHKDSKCQLLISPLISNKENIYFTSNFSRFVVIIVFYHNELVWYYFQAFQKNLCQFFISSWQKLFINCLNIVRNEIIVAYPIVMIFLKLCNRLWILENSWINKDAIILFWVFRNKLGKIKYFQS